VGDIGMRIKQLFGTHFGTCFKPDKGLSCLVVC
jgi:hypothetical protein